MKQLRQAIAATATVAALAAPGPIALLSVSAAYAPAAYADTAAGVTDPQASEGADASPAARPGLSGEGESPSPGESVPSDQAATGSATDSTTTPAATPSPTSPTDGATTPVPQESPSASGTARPAPSILPSPHIGQPVPVPTGGPTPGPSESGEPSDNGSQAIPGDGWSPSHCTDFVPDDSLSVDVTGLPSKIAAGSGWHPFTFSVANHTGASLRNVYVQSFTEYATGVNEQASLQLDLAQLQFHDPSTGGWSDAFQDSYRDDTGSHRYSGTFVALVRDLDRDARVDLQLRVRVVPTAPAGAGFALSTAVYAGQGSSCNINGDTYHFTVLKAGSDPGPVDDARPTGEKPTDGARPQGAAQIYPVGGDLARTGTSEAVPVIGLIGAMAVIVGSVLVFASRRRGIALAEAAEAADAAAGTATLTVPAQTAGSASADDAGPLAGTDDEPRADAAVTAGDPAGSADPHDPHDAASEATAEPPAAAATAGPAAAEGTPGARADTAGTPASDAESTSAPGNPAAPGAPEAGSEPDDTSGKPDTA
jgi:HAMP domain-containing protein